MAVELGASFKLFRICLANETERRFMLPSGAITTDCRVEVHPDLTFTLVLASRSNTSDCAQNGSKRDGQLSQVDREAAPRVPAACQSIQGVKAASTSVRHGAPIGCKRPDAKPASMVVALVFVVR
jgi:hypothetical protein